MHTSVRGIVEKKEGIVLIHRIKPKEDRFFKRLLCCTWW